jgi:predicted TIM-barrel fold metal-dependent hydrolase
MSAGVGKMVADYRRKRDALELFDVNCWAGRPLAPIFTPIEGMDRWKSLLARCGIRRAVVSHTMCFSYCAAQGNRAMAEAIRGEEMLLGAAVLTPEMARPGEWFSVLKSMIADRVRVIRLFPRSHNFLLDSACLGGMLEAMEELRLPLIVWHTEAGWREIAAVCERHRRLPVVVEGTGRKLIYDNRIYYSLLERLSNLRLEGHNLTNYLGLDDLVARFGSTRILFGSYYPHEDPNSAAMLLTHGDMTDEDRRNIAHGNLEQLIAEVESG